MVSSRGDETLGVDTLRDRLWHLTLPAAVLSVETVGRWSRFMRGSLFEVLGKDYIRTARAKGLGETAIIGKHAFETPLFP